eukprot:COSAG01_NODE_47447_length_390_cov_0.838488_1_plen_73_part_01
MIAAEEAAAAEEEAAATDGLWLSSLAPRPLDCFPGKPQRRSSLVRSRGIRAPQGTRAVAPPPILEDYLSIRTC